MADVTEVDEIANEQQPVDNPDNDADTFPREYVERLRGEAADQRTKAKAAEDRAEALARELFAARVAATGKLANPAELEYNADILDDPEAIDAAIEAAIAERSYIASRRPSGNVGQGVKGSEPERFSLLDRLKGN